MPNHTCCVPGCYNRSSQTKTDASSIRYYKFPADRIQRRAWLKNISRERSFKPTANSRVCSDHFVGGIKDENYSIPTLFLWKKLRHPSHTGFSSKSRGVKPKLRSLQPDADGLKDISDLPLNGHLTEGKQPNDDMSVVIYHLLQLNHLQHLDYPLGKIVLSHPSAR